MDAFIIAYIQQRMRDLGYKNYTFNVVRIYPTSMGLDPNNYTINGSNEYYYHVSKTVPASLKIVSDTNIWDESSVYSNFNFYQIQEFTGQIKITTTPGVGNDIDLEFIQVVPRIIPKKKKVTTSHS